MQTDNGKRIPIVVPDDQMRHFMAVTATYDEQLLYLDPAEINFQQGDLVRITQGIFTGVVGRFLRIKGGRSRRVVVSVQGVKYRDDNGYSYPGANLAGHSPPGFSFHDG